jgi:alpha-glucosidase
MTEMLLEPRPAQGAGTDWWRDAVVYQIYPRSFADANGDGLGDLPGITLKLDYLQDLGVDAIWMSPFYPSPLADGGYDVLDYCDVDPRLGTLQDFTALVDGAHDSGLKIIIDIVPNHTSSEHSWFKEALASAPGSPERERYIFKNGQGD